MNDEGGQGTTKRWMHVDLGAVTRTLAFTLSAMVCGAPGSVFSVSFPRQIYL